MSDDGYGRFTLNQGGRTEAVRPHRFAFHLAHGLDLAGFGPLMHACDVPICVRATTGPDSHLTAGDARLNMLDRLAKNRDTNGSTFRWRAWPTGISRSSPGPCTMKSAPTAGAGKSACAPCWPARILTHQHSSENSGRPPAPPGASQ